MLGTVRSKFATLRGKNVDSTPIEIAGVRISRKDPVYIIAEIGINHNGSMEVAKKMIDAAAEAKCQAVKFQKRTVPAVYSADELAKPRKVDRSLLESAIKRGVLSAEAVKRLQDSNFENSTNGDLKWALEFTEAEYKQLFDYAKSKGIFAFASPWDVESVAFLEKLGVPCYKIASACVTDLDLLRAVHATGKPVILSTGMSTYEEVDEAVGILGYKNGLVLLHTVSTYPADFKDINLRIVTKLRQRYPKAFIGYSGHEAGTGISIAASTLGARVIERHLTLDRTMFGTDQAASIEPADLKRLVSDIRDMEKAYGDGVKRVVEGELPVRAKLRKKSYAAS